MSPAPQPPTDLRPMLATRAPLPADPAGWAFELKWDGIRALVAVADGRVRLTSRNGNDITDRYPELQALAGDLGATRVVLDAEIVAVDEHGRPDFQRLQRRMHVQSAAAQARFAVEVPVTCILFDVLWCDGRSTTELPYERRRDLLEALDLNGPSWRTPAVARQDPEPILAFARARGFEGVVAKRLDGRYEPGRRSRSWIKHAFRLRQELVVGGWLEGEGTRRGTIGALLLGYHLPGGDGDPGPLRYAGKVGTGFSDAELRRLDRLLAERTRPTSPFGAGRPPAGAHHVEPELVAEVEFTQWTEGGTVRHPSYLGLRDDRDPATVVRET